jgi:hypothetical protein
LLILRKQGKTGTRWPRIKFMVVAALAVTAACSPGDNAGGDELPGTPAGPRVIVMDTAWRMSSELLVRVRAMRMSGDRLVAANGGSEQVLLVNVPDGRITTLGRAGRGPGDFMSVTDLAIRGDSILVLDGLSKRIQLFVAVGDSARLERVWTLPSEGIPQRVFILSDNSVAVSIRSGPPRFTAVAPLKVFRDTTRVSILGERAGQLSQIAAFPAQEYIYDEMPRLIQPPFSTTAYHELGDSGITVADGRTGEVAIHAWDASRKTVLIPAKAPEVISDADLDAWKARIDARAARINARAERDRDPVDYTRMAHSALSAFDGGRPVRPWYSGILSDSRVLAIQRYQPDEADGIAEYEFLNPAGQARGTWEVPPHIRVMGIHGDTVLAVSRDSLDVESLLILVRPG